MDVASARKKRGLSVQGERRDKVEVKERIKKSIKGENAATL